ncbi:hypothetical protein N9L47_11235 [Rhodobacteraceae bacterium]|nr:hypothetical protein [Paracoccaceae bacterium]
MPNKLYVLLSLLILSACAAAPEVPDAKVIPIKAFLSANRALPYECLNYNARNDTCKILAKRSVSGNILKLDVNFFQFLRYRGSVSVRIVSDFEIGQTAYCGNLENAVIEGQSTIIPPHIVEEILVALRKDLANEGTQCSEYLRDDEGRFYTRSRDRSGRAIGTTDRIWLFAEPKALSG